LSQRQGRTDGQGNQLTYFSEDSAGFKLSPQTVMLICLIYIGSVVILHIFGKVKSTTMSSAQAQPDMGGPSDL
jgi:protein transport protein SEC61 subunit beta